MITFDKLCKFFESIQIDENELRGKLVEDNKYVANLKDSNLFNRCYEKFRNSGLYDDPISGKCDVDNCNVDFYGKDVDYYVHLSADLAAEIYTLILEDATDPDPILVENFDE